MSYRVFCPLLNKEIDDDICFDIHMVVDTGAPKWTAPKEIYDVPDYEKICQSCKNHQTE